MAAFVMDSKSLFNIQSSNNNADGGDDSDDSRIRNNGGEDDGSRSGSNNEDGGDDGKQRNGRTRKKYKRHTPEQIQELENLFKVTPHPDEKKRIELSMRLNLDSRQVKFWFQNRRTQLKAQIERYENSKLREEKEKLMEENASIKATINNPFCPNCSGTLELGDVAHEELQLLIENARLTDELQRAYAIVTKFLS